MKKAHHPKGLYILFFTEMWERFSYYLMIGILYLYMTDTETGGLGLSTSEATGIYGTYIALVYLTPFFGGLIADRWLGYRRAIVLGGLLMMVGHVLLAFEGMPFFYSALAFLVAGSGFFKANMSNFVGRLYAPDDPLREAGYSIFYMGINIGAFICNFVAAVLRHNWGWHAAFGSAGVGMALGVLIFASHYRRFAHADRREEVAATPHGARDVGTLLAVAVVPALVAGALAYWATDDLTVAFFAALAPVVAFYIGVLLRSPPGERSRIGALLALYAAMVFFWMIFHQNGSILTHWAQNYTDRRIDPVSLKVMKALRIEEEATPLYFANASPDTPRPARASLRIVGEAEYRRASVDREVREQYKRRKEIPVTAEIAEKIYRRATPDTPTLAPGESLPLWSSELFQSVNAGFIILLTPAVVLLWAGLRRLKREPTTPTKIFLGLVVTAVSTAFMVLAVHAGRFGETKVSPWWLIGNYFIITVAELFLSPMGLSIVSRMAPPRVGGLMMGGWYMAIAAGNKLTSYMGALWEKWEAQGHQDWFFWLLTGCAAASAMSLFFMLPWLKRVMRGVT